MKQYPLYIDKKNTYYLVCNVFNCENCYDEMFFGEIFFYTAIWSKKKSIVKIVCKDCLMKIEKSVGLVFESKFGFITNTKLEDFTPVLLSPPEFKEKKISPFDIDNKFWESDNTKDNVWRSKVYPSIEGATIGLSLEELDLSSDNLITFVEESKKKKLLEHRKEVI